MCREWKMGKQEHFLVNYMCKVHVTIWPLCASLKGTKSRLVKCQCRLHLALIKWSLCANVILRTLLELTSRFLWGKYHYYHFTEEARNRKLICIKFGKWYSTIFLLILKCDHRLEGIPCFQSDSDVSWEHFSRESRYSWYSAETLWAPCSIRGP